MEERREDEVVGVVTCCCHHTSLSCSMTLRSFCSSLFCPSRPSTRSR